ncbi:oxygen-insensitive NADPH nitroreductase [Enterococcus durans]|nr:oxygen-insensitive NADPH nitroreductase [Enterococcus durans]
MFRHRFFSPISQIETISVSTSFDIYIYTIETGGIFRPNVFLSDQYKNGNIGRNLKDKGKSHMNETTELLKKHVSVRQFLDKKINEDQVKELILAAQSASSASFLQAYTIIGIEDDKLKGKIAELAGNQPFISEGSHFFVFCADLQRLHRLSQERNIDIQPMLEGVDAILAGAIDASLAAQNMTVAAESMGLGVCYIGGIRDAIVEISDLLELPEYVFPVFGLVVGYPKAKNELKPRIPMAGIYHIDKYNKDTDEISNEYEETTRRYYTNRIGNSSNKTWGDGTVNSFHRLSRMGMKDYLNKQGLAKK